MSKWTQAADEIFFFFQAEDGIRHYKVTGVQTCALPISAAVVKDPAGSAKNEIPNGGTSAFLAAESISRARMAFLPPMNIPVRTPVLGGREKIASCTRPPTSSSVTFVYGI